MPPLTGTQHVGSWALLFQGSDPHLGSRAMNPSLRSLLGEQESSWLTITMNKLNK